MESRVAPESNLEYPPNMAQSLSLSVPLDLNVLLHKYTPVLVLELSITKHDAVPCCVWGLYWSTTRFFGWCAIVCGAGGYSKTSNLPL